MDPTAPIPNPDDVAHDFRPMIVVYKDGHVDRYPGSTTTIPPSSDDPASPVLSKDVTISPTASVRIFLPSHKSTNLPLIIYFHGGGFVIESAKSPTYHRHLSRLASDSNSIIVSVDYRLAPEHPLPAAYDDSWSAVLWTASLSDPWLADHADPSRLIFAGDSAGGNIAHHMAVNFGSDPPGGLNLVGLALIHPFFAYTDILEADPDSKSAAELRNYGIRFWEFLCPGGGLDHPWVNPVAEGKLAGLGAKKAVVFVAEEDSLRNRGVWYVEQLRKSGWSGEVELVETIGEGHCFHLIKPPSSNSAELMRKMVEFINP